MSSIQHNVPLKASVSMFTLIKTYCWMKSKRAKVLTWLREAFANDVTKQLEAAACHSRRASEDNLEHKAKTFYVLPPRQEILTLELRRLCSVDDKDENSESESICTDQYYQQYRRSIS